VSAYLAGPASAERPFDLVFVDPPYAEFPLSRDLPALLPMLAQDARVVAEVRWSRDDPPGQTRYVLEADRRYGDTRVLVYARSGD
jgi:16S rRNA G966 N2-methylase RsmD